MADDTQVDLEEVRAELAVAKEALAAKDQEIESFKRKGGSVNDLAKKTKELEKEKLSAEEVAAGLTDRVAKLEESEKSANEKATKARAELYESMFRAVGLTEDQKKLVDYHYKNTLSTDDSTLDGMSSRFQHSLTVAGVNNMRQNPIFNTGSLSTAPSFAKIPELTPEEHEVAKKFGMKPEEYIEYRDKPIAVE